MNNKLAILFVLLFLSAGAAAGVFWKNAAGLTVEKQALENKLAQLERSLDEARTEAKRAEVSAATSLAAQKSELLQLRNEVTQRRGVGEAADKVRVENERLLAENQQLRSRVERAELAAVQANQPRAADPNETTDPLAFFRKNPELMKRYFPHLAASEPKPGEAPPPEPQP